MFVDDELPLNEAITYISWEQNCIAAAWRHCATQTILGDVFGFIKILQYTPTWPVHIWTVYFSTKRIHKKSYAKSVESLLTPPPPPPISLFL